VKNKLKVLRAEREWSQARLALPLAFKLARVFELLIEEIFEP